MKKNEEISKLKDFYQNKNGKAIFFFGFYLIFFITLAFVFRNENNRVKDDNSVSSLMTIRDLYQKDFLYHFEIDDNGSIIVFNGSKKNLDYNSYEYKYFLDYVNINQLIKKSKVTNVGENYTSYEMSNKVLNNLLNTKQSEGINKILENYGYNDYSITLDLKEFMGKETFVIKLNYKVGDNNE